MNTETKSSFNAPGNVDPKQRAVAIIFILVVIFLVWQIHGLFSKKSSKENKAPTEITQKQAASEGASSLVPAKPQKIAPQTAADAQQMPAKPQQAKQEDPLLAAISVKDAKQQKRYIEALNELQLLQLKKQIAEAESAIATSKLKSVQTQKSMDEITKKASPASIEEYAKSLVTPQTIAGKTVITKNGSVNYTLLSVSKQNNKWSAVLGYDNKLYNVTVGDRLEIDGSLVKSININGITLRKNGHDKMINLTPII